MLVVCPFSVTLFFCIFQSTAFYRELFSCPFLLFVLSSYQRSSACVLRVFGFFFMPFFLALEYSFFSPGVWHPFPFSASSISTFFFFRPQLKETLYGIWILAHSLPFLPLFFIFPIWVVTKMRLSPPPPPPLGVNFPIVDYSKQPLFLLLLRKTTFSFPTNLFFFRIFPSRASPTLCSLRDFSPPSKRTIPPLLSVLGQTLSFSQLSIFSLLPSIRYLFFPYGGFSPNLYP